jgi:hypothetical protein
MLSANNLAALASHGAGFALEAKMFHPDELVRIAGAGQGRLVIRDSKHLSVENMIRIARARPHLVFFEGL